MRAIIFDFDGVIVDTKESMQKGLDLMGVSYTEESFLAHHDGNVYEEAKIDFPMDKIHLFESHGIENIPHIRLFLSVEKLHGLAEKFLLFIVSSNGEKTIGKYMEHHAMTCFTKILGSNFHKSKVEKIQYILTEYQLQKEDVVFVTDTLGDIKEGKKVGVKIIAVSYGFHNKERLEKGNPDVIIETPEELLTTLTTFLQ